MMRIVIADDEPLALLRLRTLLGEMQDVEIVGEAQDGASAETLIRDLEPDVAILDIRMPQQSGMSLAASLRDVPVEVIFVTAFDHFAAQAFEVDAVDYLMKPPSLARLETALSRAGRRLSVRDGGRPAPPGEGAAGGVGEVVWVPGRNGLVGVPLATIEWIEAAKDYMLLHTSSRAHIVRSTMEKIQSLFPDDSVLRISRSATIRRDAFVELVRDGSSGLVAVLRDGTALKVGPSYVSAVRQHFPDARPVAGRAGNPSRSGG